MVTRDDVDKAKASAVDADAAADAAEAGAYEAAKAAYDAAVAAWYKYFELKQAFEKREEV